MSFWDPLDKSSDIGLDVDGLVLTRLSSSNNQWRAARSLTAKSAGKWYAEIENGGNGGGNGYMIAGLAPAAAPLTSYPGGAGNSYGLQANNNTNLLSYNSGSTSVLVSGSSASISVGQRMMIAVDFDAGKVWFGTKGVWRNGNPAAGTGANYTFTPGAPLFICAALYGTPQIVAGVLPEGHIHDIPSGFQAWFDSGPATVQALVAVPSPLGVPSVLAEAPALEAVLALAAVPSPLAAPVVRAAPVVQGVAAVPSPLGAPAVSAFAVPVALAAIPSPLGVPVLDAIVHRYELAGVVRDQGVAVERRVRAYLRSSGALVAEADTAAGAFRLEVGFEAAEHYLVPLDLDAEAADYAPPCANRVVSELVRDEVPA